MTRTDAVPAPEASRRYEVRIANVVHTYLSEGQAEVAALDGIDLSIAEGEVVCIVGPSGCGKTTLLQLVAGFLRPSKGSVTIGGKSITGPDSSRGVVFQEPMLFPWLSVRDNVSLGPKMRGVGRGQYETTVDWAIKTVGLTEFGSRRTYELSGGMQQRVAIARILANDSAVMLMDEPFGALDALTREAMQSELLALWEATSKTIVFITHSVDEAVYLGCRVIVMTPRPGRIVKDMDVRHLKDRDSVDFLEARKEIRSLIFGGGVAGSETESIVRGAD